MVFHLFSLPLRLSDRRHIMIMLLMIIIIWRLSNQHVLAALLDEATVSGVDSALPREKCVCVCAVRLADGI